VAEATRDGMAAEGAATTIGGAVAAGVAEAAGKGMAALRVPTQDPRWNRW
jgi:hypothetical protein